MESTQHHAPPSSKAMAAALLQLCALGALQFQKGVLDCEGRKLQSESPSIPVPAPISGTALSSLTVLNK